jgi:hypothetical protein
MNPPSWAAELYGPEVDLAYLARSQVGPLICVERRDGAYLLFGRHFDGLPDATVARVALEEATQVLSGLLVLLRYGKDILGVTFDGSVCQRYYAVPISLTLSFDDGEAIHTTGDAP